MTQATANQHIIETIQKLDEPESLKNLRLRAYEKAAGLGLPSRSLESWRKFPLTGIDPHRINPQDSTAGLRVDAPSQAKVMSFSEVLSSGSQYADEFLQQIEQALKEEQDIFASLNLALFHSSAFIVLEKNASAPIKIQHEIQSGNTLAPFIFIIAEPGTENRVHEVFQGKPGDDTSWILPRTHFILKEDSRIQYLSNRKYFDSENHFHRVQIEQYRNSYMEEAILHRGGMRGKGFSITNIHETGAEFQGFGIGIGKNNEFHDLEMHVRHYDSNGISRILYKTVLMDRAHHVFDGNLFIPKGLKNIDAYQVNNNILLSPKARAESMPRLVTLAEDVQCEHGATVGDLDPESIFFLQARGIPEAGARDILIQGFIHEVLEKLPISEEEIETIDNEILEIIRK